MINFRELRDNIINDAFTIKFDDVEDLINKYGTSKELMSATLETIQDLNDIDNISIKKRLNSDFLAVNSAALEHCGQVELVEKLRKIKRIKKKEILEKTRKNKEKKANKYMMKINKRRILFIDEYIKDEHDFFSDEKLKRVIPPKFYVCNENRTNLEIGIIQDFKRSKKKEIVYRYRDINLKFGVRQQTLNSTFALLAGEMNADYGIFTTKINGKMDYIYSLSAFNRDDFIVYENRKWFRRIYKSNIFLGNNVNISEKARTHKDKIEKIITSSIIDFGFCKIVFINTLKSEIKAAGVDFNEITIDEYYFNNLNMHIEKVKITTEYIHADSIIKMISVDESILIDRDLKLNEKLTLVQSRFLKLNIKRVRK